MIDTGADINLIKTKKLAKRTIINTKRIVQLTGISPDTQKTLGTVELIIFGEKTTFHVVDNHFPISADGIIGNEFLRSTPTNIDYIREVLIVKNRRVPFTVSDKVGIPPRTSKVIFCHVINADVKDGYIPRIQLPIGVYAGEALVGNVDGRAYFRLINTTSRFVSLQIPKLELLAYNIETLPSLPYNAGNNRKDVVKNVNARSINAQSASNKISNYQPNDKLFRRYSNKINMGKDEGPSLPGHAANFLIETDKRINKDRIRTKDKHDRATVEQVMDARTKIILFKFLNQGIIGEINGCISTEKEVRNLTRINQAGINAPKPIRLRSHVLLMEFIGTNDWPSPKLKDADINASKYRKLYTECIKMMWQMYHKCKLVHADLSEYNMLYRDGSLVLMDVS
ncbi:hypothetical protein M0804_015307 [Polistes exclamans]|nr:hypothetical protein M0804_015307 [Polistes exclamans]